MYNNGNINISYRQDNLEVHCKNSSSRHSGRIKPSCEGYITLDNKRKTFKYNEENEEIVFDGSDAEEKWIKGWFS